MYIKGHIHIPIWLSNSPALSLSLICPAWLSIPLWGQVCDKDTWRICPHVSLFYSFKIINSSPSAFLLTLSKLFRLTSCWLHWLHPHLLSKPPLPQSKPSNSHESHLSLSATTSHAPLKFMSSHYWSHWTPLMQEERTRPTYPQSTLITSITLTVSPIHPFTYDSMAPWLDQMV